MPEFRSALAGQPLFRAPIAESDLAIEEVTDHDLLQLAGWPGSFEAVLARLSQLCGCPVPRDTRCATTAGAATLFRTGPDRVWLAALRDRNLGAEFGTVFTTREAVVTELRHSRTVFNISGRLAADLLARFIAIDLDDREFAIGNFAQTALLHTGVLLHRVSVSGFDVYVPRSYALSIWESMIGASDLLTPRAPSTSPT